MLQYQYDTGAPSETPDCIDLNGDCTRPCHAKYVRNEGECPYGDSYHPENFNYEYDFSETVPPESTPDYPVDEE